MIDPNDWNCWRDELHEVKPTTFGWPQCTVCRAAPDFPQRYTYIPESFMLAIFVPVVDTPIIARGSGVVGLPEHQNRKVVYYEGWVNGAMQYEDRDAYGKWEAGVEHAAGRMVVDYPTVAQAALPIEMLKPVGLYYPKTRLLHVDDQVSVDDWLEA